MTYPFSPVIPYLSVNKRNIPSIITEQLNIALQNMIIQGDSFRFISLVDNVYSSLEDTLPNVLVMLELATKYGRLNILKYLLGSHHSNEYSVFPNGSTILHTAAEYGHLDIIKYLMSDYQVDLNIRLQDGWAVIHIAARNGYYNIIEFLVDQDTVDINIALPDGRKALDIAIHYIHLGIMAMLAPFAVNRVPEENYNIYDESDSYYSEEIVEHSGVSNPFLMG